MQLPIAGLELLLAQEERVVEQREGIEDVEVVLFREDEGVVHKELEARGEGFLELFGRLLCGGGGEGGFAGVVEEVGGADGVLAVVGAEDGGLNGQDVGLR